MMYFSGNRKHLGARLLINIVFTCKSMSGPYQGPPVMAPPQYNAAPPPKREPGFLEGWY